MRKILLIIFYIFLCPCFVFADIDSVFYNSNNLYNSNQFDKALEGYLAIVNEDENNGVLYYNIGNCYYRLNQLGYARLYYEKSKLYNPTDRDILHNIEIIETQLIDQINQVPEFFLIRFIKSINKQFSPSQWGYLMVFVLYFNLFLFLLFLFTNLVDTRLNCLRGLLFSVPVLLCVAFFLIYSNLPAKYNDAVLVAPNAYVKTAPSESADDYFIIHEGLKFQVIDQVSNWSRISLLDGKDGWVKTVDFEVIK